MKDIKYWNNFYNSFNKLEASKFCSFIISYLDSKHLHNLKILDAGCGNGRDSYHLSRKNIVLGVDSSGFIPKNDNSTSFKSDDFCRINKEEFDLVYSRFTLHSITDEQQEEFFDSIKNPGTYLCIETRSDKGVDTNRHYGDGHYRNFTNIDYLKEKLKKHNFEVYYLEESDNFAPYKEENPICIRVMCKKL